MELQSTADGSATIYNADLKATYHSRHGAIQESRHIYTQQGLQHAESVFGKTLRVVEAGFGTGLNAFLTMQEAEIKRLSIDYTSIEKYPLSLEIVEQLNYPEQLSCDKSLFSLLHSFEWNKPLPVTDHFHFTKYQADILSFSFPKDIHCVYYDAFAPDTSPDMWQESIFKKLYMSMLPGACLVTFCAKGDVKRLLKHVGFKIEALDGPPGKREMVRALKN